LRSRTFQCSGLLEETGYGGGVWTEFIRIAPNASAANNWSYCYIAEDVEKIGKQSLEESEDLTVHLVTFNELKDLLENGKIVQATMAAPLWKFMALYDNF
jgi:ADP-ribose pyrophosphatase